MIRNISLKIERVENFLLILWKQISPLILLQYSSFHQFRTRNLKRLVCSNSMVKMRDLKKNITRSIKFEPILSTKMEFTFTRKKIDILKSKYIFEKKLFLEEFYTNTFFCDSFMDGFFSQNFRIIHQTI